MTVLVPARKEFSVNLRVKTLARMSATEVELAVKQVIEGRTKLWVEQISAKANFLPGGADGSKNAD